MYNYGQPMYINGHSERGLVVVVGSHGLWTGKAAYSPVNGRCSCWLVSCWFSWALDRESCQWSGKRAMQLLVG